MIAAATTGKPAARARLRAWLRSRRVRRSARMAALLVLVVSATVAADFGYQFVSDYREFAQFKAARADKTARMQAHTKALFDELCVANGPPKRGGRAEKICTAVIEESLAAGIAPADGLALVTIESNFHLAAMSDKGAYGLTQMRLSVHQPGSECDLAMDARCNLRKGFEYYVQLLTEFGGDRRLAALAYNRGPGTVRAVLREEGGDPSNGYFQKWEAAKRGVNV